MSAIDFAPTGTHTFIDNRGFYGSFSVCAPCHAVDIEIGDRIRRIDLDSTSELCLSLRIPSELLQHNSEPTVRFVRIWGQLRCCSEKPFCLLTLSVVRQEKARLRYASA